MSIGSILLRLMVCLCLILQGTQAAFAATAIEQHVSHAAMALHAAAPCHAHGKAAIAAHPAASMQGHMSTGSGHPKPDCCQHATCSCDCAQFAIADILLHPMLRMELAPQRILLPMDEGLPAPLLPHLIRPPIG
jgi:hypothetical protein